VLSQYSDADGNMSTLPDPRSRTPADESSLPPSPTAHPDLTSEVETLSNKLISAINHQTNLDDNLSATRQELSVAQERIKQLEQETSDHAEMMARGILIRKSVADIEKAKLAQQLVDERKQREVVEKEKKGIEQELENLTTALFEEANNVSSWSLCIN
jgi:chromosome segregation ATPase